MMRVATVLTLLMVFGATPALALVCETLCAEAPAQTGRASHASHRHHHAGTQSSVIGHRSSVLETSRDVQCRSHVTIEPATPERSLTLAIEAAPASLRLFEPLVQLTHSGSLAEVRPPPPESRAATPLRI
jgi:hypothetical protein